MLNYSHPGQKVDSDGECMAAQGHKYNCSCCS